MWKVVWSRRKEDSAVYEKNSRRPCGAHGQKEFCTENKKEQTRKKQKFFGKIFVLNNYGIFLGK